MKKFVVSTMIAFASTAVLSAAPSDSDTNQVAGGTSAMFTNSAGQVFSAAKLADNLKTLRASIEQTMPMVAAVAESQTNSASVSNPTKNSSLTGKVEDFVSGAIKRNQNEAAGQNQSASGKVLDSLRGLLKTNSNNTATASATEQSTLQSLNKLNDQLKGLLPTLDQLNVTASSSGASANGSALTPTGR